MLYLIPTPLGKESDFHTSISSGVQEIVQKLDGLICESMPKAQEFLRKCNFDPSGEIEIHVLDKRKTKQRGKARKKGQGYEDIFSGMLKGETWGIISDCGCPGIADPGAEMVAQAHQWGIQVVPLPGPSSILLALMGSGFTGQSFAFHGYLPKDQKDRVRCFKALEKESHEKKQTQIFMETPFRNEHLWDDLLFHLRGKTQLAICVDLTFPSEKISVKNVEQWRESEYPDIHKKPVIFVLYAK